MESNTFYDIYLEELKNLPQGTPEEDFEHTREAGTKQFLTHMSAR